MMLSTLVPGVMARIRAPIRPPRRGPRHGGFTLIEILVSLVITLIMMGAVVTLFGVVTDSVSGSRALLETADKLRACRNRLASDLAGATVTPIPPRRPENDEGYLQVVEGVQTDSSFAGLTVANVSFASLFGDCDDALLLTTRSAGDPFIGKFNGTTTIDSQTAEVAYFLRQDGPIIGFDNSGAEVRLFTLYRRCMVVVPSSTASLGSLVVGAPFYNLYDVSARFEGTPQRAVANSLGDLTKPENRFSRQAGAWPTNVRFTTPPVFNNVRSGDDVMMTNVLAFDVQVFDPGAPVFVHTATPATIEPRDSDYLTKLNAWRTAMYPASPNASAPIAFGAFVDLGYMFNVTYGPPATFPQAQLNFAPAAKSGYTTTGTPRPAFVYDTWSLHFEADGVLQASTVPVPMSMTNMPDAGMNGIDDDGNGVIDDRGEFDTEPPYSAPLHGLRVTIRVYEPSSQQIRQVTVVQDFSHE